MLKKATTKNAAGAARSNSRTQNTLAKIVQAKMAGIVFAKSVEIRKNLKLDN